MSNSPVRESSPAGCRRPKNALQERREVAAQAIRQLQWLDNTRTTGKAIYHTAIHILTKDIEDHRTP